MGARKKEGWGTACTSDSLGWIAQLITYKLHKKICVFKRKINVTINKKDYLVLSSSVSSKTQAYANEPFPAFFDSISFLLRQIDKK